MDTIIEETDASYTEKLSQNSIDRDINAIKIKICLKAREILSEGTMYDLYTNCVNDLPYDKNNKDIEDLRTFLNSQGTRCLVLTGAYTYRAMICKKISRIDDYTFLDNLYRMFK